MTGVQTCALPICFPVTIVGGTRYSAPVVIFSAEPTSATGDEAVSAPLVYLIVTIAVAVNISNDMLYFMRTVFFFVVVTCKWEFVVCHFYLLMLMLLRLLVH